MSRKRNLHDWDSVYRIIIHPNFTCSDYSKFMRVYNYVIQLFQKAQACHKEIEGPVETGPEETLETPDTPEFTETVLPDLQEPELPEIEVEDEAMKINIKKIFDKLLVKIRTKLEVKINNTVIPIMLAINKIEKKNEDIESNIELLFSENTNRAKAIDSIRKDINIINERLKRLSLLDLLPISEREKKKEDSDEEEKSEDDDILGPQPKTYNV